jgi:hypothetical protein
MLANMAGQVHLGEQVVIWGSTGKSQALGGRRRLTLEEIWLLLREV